MAVVHLQEFELVDRSTAIYDAVTSKLEAQGKSTPEGLLIHTAGFDDDANVFRIFEVWETKEAGERFETESLRPILDPELAAAPESRPPTSETWYEIHNYLPAELKGYHVHTN